MKPHSLEAVDGGLFCQHTKIRPVVKKLRILDTSKSPYMYILKVMFEVFKS